ncbi:MAG: ABC transporter ATP-binding protein [Verrucomicrobia bacterium]|nr:ABC transporter ATP-binding protein [Verrucomicrobiota bacterium]
MSESSLPLIRLRALTKRFGSRLALDRLDLDVSRGEVFGLLGHNGAGKSTAIGMMLGQVWPTDGEVHIFGADVTNDRRRALARVGAIFETPVFYDYLSGWRNLQILASYTAPTPDQRLREVLDWVGLTGREQSKVRTYSHGMRARLALAQALLPSPELLILDEPSDGLDPEGIHEMRQTVLRLRRELGLTILLSSHLLNEVEQLCTRIAVLRQGRKVFDGPLTEVVRGHNWFRLRTDDFGAAAALLRAEGLVRVVGADGRLQLAGDVTPDRVVARLVGAGVRVYEFAAEEQTLEDFYLGLMREPAVVAS